MHAQIGSPQLRQEGWEGRNWEGSNEKSMETVVYSFMKNTEQCADSDALVHKAGFLQVLGQTHSHQLQQVGVP